MGGGVAHEMLKHLPEDLRSDGAAEFTQRAGRRAHRLLFRHNTFLSGLEQSGRLSRDIVSGSR